MSSNVRLEVTTSLNRTVFVIPVMIAALLMLGLVVFRLQSYGALLPMFGLIGACLGVLVVLRPAIGVVALIFSAAFVRITVGTGTDSAIVASLLCAILLILGWVIHRMIAGKRLQLLPRSIAIPAAVLASATLFSFLWGRLVLDPRIQVPETFYRVQIGQALLTLVSLGLLFVSADVLRNHSTRNILVGVMLIVGMIALPFRWFGWESIGVNTAGLFGLWFVALCWSHALSNSDLHRWMRLGLGALALSWLLMAYVREGSWVSGWLPAVLAVLLITIIARPRLGLILSLVSVIGVTIYFSVLYSVLITAQENEGSIGGEFGRLELIQRNLGLIKEHLLFGTGPAGYALYYVTFFPDHAMSTHNNYVDILSQNGAMGLISFVVLLFSLALLAYRLVPHVTNHTDRSHVIAIAGGIPALIFSLWLGDWLIPFVYNQTIAGFDHAVYSWLMLACLCGLYAEYHSREKASA